MRITTCFFAVALSLMGQVPFVAVNVVPNPDSLVAFDALNPAAATSPAVAGLAGNFVRGIELTAERTGWYVASGSTAGSPVGFFRLDDGVSQFVAPLPYSAGGVGGLAFNAAEDALYWIADADGGSVQYELWRIDFNGTFTLLSSVSLQGVATSRWSGLALDPTTNSLYAIDTTSDVLAVIDPQTGVANQVGSGLGVDLPGMVGGLDFALDGTHRLFLAAGTAIHPVDVQTGRASALTGRLPFITSSIAAIPGRATLKAPAVLVGQLALVQILRGPAIGAFALYTGTATAGLPVPGLGVVRLNPFDANFSEVWSGPLDAQGNWSLPLAIPQDPGLAGFHAPLQAYTIDLASGRMELTNAVEFRIL